MIGEIGILNVGAGDTKLTFDKSKAAEVRRAARVVTDMLARGFAILVEVGQDEKGPLYRRAEAFDAETCEYIIVGAPEDDHEEAASEPTETQTKKAPRRGRPRKVRVPASSTRAVAVARSAGG